MDLPKQKNFYDVKRQFQGKDSPTAQPEPERTAREPLPRGQIIFGLILIAFVAALAFLKIRGADAELVPTTPTVATAPAHATKP
ncbi:MAG: hypothetical protein ACHQ17_09060 [Polyangia bacterium]